MRQKYWNEPSIHNAPNTLSSLSVLPLQFCQPAQELSIEDITLIDIKGMRALTNKSTSTIRRYIAKNILPKPNRHHTGQQIWILSELRPYLAAFGVKESV